MKTYVYVIFYFLVFDYTLWIAVYPSIVPPKKYGKRFESKSKTALLANKIIEKIVGNKVPQVDVFHEIAVWVQFVFFVISLIVCVVDACLNYFISNYMGYLKLSIITVIIFFVWISYELFLTIWWHYANN